MPSSKCAVCDGRTAAPAVQMALQLAVVLAELMAVLY